MRERKRNWAQLSQTFKLYSPAKTKPKPTENNRAFCKTDSGLEVRPAMLC